MNTTTTLAWANRGNTPGTLELSLLTSDNIDAEADKDLRTLLIRADELCRIINDRDNSVLRNKTLCLFAGGN